MEGVKTHVEHEKEAKKVCMCVSIETSKSAKMAIEFDRTAIIDNSSPQIVETKVKHHLS